MTDIRALANRIIDVIVSERASGEEGANALILALGTGIGMDSPDQSALGRNMENTIAALRKLAQEAHDHKLKAHTGGEKDGR